MLFLAGPCLDGFAAALHAMIPASIPSLPLGCCLASSADAEMDVFVGRFERLNTCCARLARAHRHEHIELFWLRGPGLLLSDSNRYELPGSKSTLVVIAPSQIHEWRERSSIRGTIVSFTGAFFDGREPPPSALQQYGFAARASFPPVLVADKTLQAELGPLFTRCEREYARRPEHWDDVIRSSLRVILAEAVRAHGRLTRAGPGLASGDERVLRFQSLVEERFRTESSVSAYASALGLTAGHLNELVKNHTGRTAGEIIRSRVLLEAKRLLFHTEMTVSETAYHLGFADPSYFAKAFRKATRQSPGDFREAVRKEHRRIRE